VESLNCDVQYRPLELRGVWSCVLNTTGYPEAFYLAYSVTVAVIIIQCCVRSCGDTTVGNL
jgi:hypothetical protein